MTIRTMIRCCLVLAATSATPVAAEPVDPAGAARRQMIELIRLETRLTAAETGIEAIDPRVLQAMGEVPREAFVPAALMPYAYQPQPLPVHPEQNLAAPLLVALMTHLARVGPGDRVLETGTGEGYHAAVLSRLAATVASVEVIPELAREAAARLDGLGYTNVTVREGDGYYGWREAGPFDAIIVKEAVNEVPPALLAQLKPGGRLVVPLGPLDDVQDLTLVEKDAQGRLSEQRFLKVRFTPLQGGERI